MSTIATKLEEQMPEPTQVRSTPGPASRHHLALTVWIAVVPTLTGLQLVLGRLLKAAPMYTRPAIMATFAVPIVVYVVMPHVLRHTTRLVKTNSQPLRQGVMT